MDVKNYKCINCASEIVFDPESSKWKCDSCKSLFTKEELDDFFYNQDDENSNPFSDSSGSEAVLQNLGDVINSEQLNSYNCQNCGGELITDENTVATFCPYCKSSSILKAKIKGEFRPGLVIPFSKTENNAKEIYHAWVKNKIYTPKSFKSKQTIDEIKGLYAPYWLYDMGIDGSIRGTGINVTTWSDSEYEYTKKDYYRVERGGDNEYKKIPNDASKKLDDDLMEKVEPFNYDEMKEFEISYMAGFFAENYDETANDCLARAKNKAASYFESRLKETVHIYDSFSVERRIFNLNNISYTYSMLPIYFLSNKFHDKKYDFIVNGQTGKISGAPPISWGLFAMYLLIEFLVIWVLASIGGVLIA